MNFLTQRRNTYRRKTTVAPAPTNQPFTNFYYKDVAELTGAGGWSVDFQRKKSYLDPQGRKILKTPEGYHPSLRTALDFYAEDYKQLASETFMACSMGTPFSTVVRMRTFEGNEFWARAIGRPVYNEDEEIIGIQGVFQDIDDEKCKELRLRSSLSLIESQNSRLFNFAHIVSHTLRSHASNLQLSLELLKSAESTEEENELQVSLDTISGQLNQTIEHLNEMVTAQSHTIDEMEPIRFDQTLQSVLQALHKMIEENDAAVFSDFSEVPEINYIPCYLKSIFLNLITNAIKYRHPDRNPVVDVCTYTESGKTCLLIKDNGLGFDLDQYGDKVFNLYETFLDDQEAIGIGLFIMKNQVETLQGSIEIESEVDMGSSFKITF